MKTPFTVLNEVTDVVKGIDEKQYASLVQLLSKDSRFFIFGEGRSGLIGKAIAMRLMHCGKNVYAVGETITPSIQKDDVLLIISGSGSSAQLEGLCQSALKQEAHIALVTANSRKLQEDWCSSGLFIPAATKQRTAEEPATIQPLGNQFDQVVHLVLDAAIVDGPYADLTHEKVRKNHANLE